LADGWEPVTVGSTGLKLGDSKADSKECKRADRWASCLEIDLALLKAAGMVSPTAGKSAALMGENLVAL
jgi:hypothetical protein